MSGSRQRAKGNIKNAVLLSLSFFVFFHSFFLSPSLLSVFAQGINANSKVDAENLLQKAYNHFRLKQYIQAVNDYRRVLEVAKEVSDSNLEYKALTGLSATYFGLRQFQQVIDSDLQRLSIAQIKNDREEQLGMLANLSLMYKLLRRYNQLIKVTQERLVLARENNNQKLEASILKSLGYVYFATKQYSRSVNFYKQALIINQRIQNQQYVSDEISDILYWLGENHLSLKQYKQALTFYQRSLEIVGKISDQYQESSILRGMGNAYFHIGERQQALDLYQQSISSARRIDERTGLRKVSSEIDQSKAFSDIGELLTEEGDTEMAIIFYKESVRTIETIRKGWKDIRLPVDLQELYIQDFVDTYKSLANLLLQQDRILEAQQVLDLLKVQELNDYLRNVRGGEQPLIVLRPEAEILKRYGELQKSAIQVGSELAQLRKAASQRTLTAAEEKRLESLDKLQDALNDQFNQFTQTAEIVNLVAQLQRSQEPVKLEQFDDLRRNLAQLGNAVLLYPLILDDRIELILTLPNTAPLRRTVYVKRTELNQTILEFRQALQNPRRDAKVPAQKLYTWLIQPLEADLKQVNAQTIIYAPDGQLRYIPLSALYDGKQWLVQRFRTNNITASSLTKFGTQAQPQLRILAGAFANQALTYAVPSGDRSLSFVGLPFAGKEVETLQAAIPNTVKYIDTAFSLQTFKPRMNGFSVVHLATHAAFVPGAPEDSFILFGDGKIANLQDIGKWDLENVDLVVLSACETGVGIQAMGAKALGDGKEVLGLGYQFQNRGARATIASLWQVDDGGTQTLMTAFYQALQNGMTKAEALRQAQIALITSQDKGTGDSQRASLRLSPQIQSSLNQQVKDKLSHPYYWAPFILIGNGL